MTDKMVVDMPNMLYGGYLKNVPARIQEDLGSWVKDCLRVGEDYPERSGKIEDRLERIENAIGLLIAALRLDNKLTDDQVMKIADSSRRDIEIKRISEE